MITIKIPTGLISTVRVALVVRHQELLSMAAGEFGDDAASYQYLVDLANELEDTIIQLEGYKRRSVDASLYAGR